MKRGIIAGTIGGLLFSGAVLAGSAGASTAACADGDGGFCGSQAATQLAQPLSLAVPNANPAIGSGLATAIPGLNRRTDFDMRAPATGESGSGGPAKIFRWAPRGIVSDLCITGHETAKSPVTLQRCRGINRQKWVPQFPSDDGTVVWVNLGTGLAMRIDTTTGAVLNKDPGEGTGLNERFAFTTGAPPPVVTTALVTKHPRSIHPDVNSQFCFVSTPNTACLRIQNNGGNGSNVNVGVTDINGPAENIVFNNNTTYNYHGVNVPAGTLQFTDHPNECLQTGPPLGQDKTAVCNALGTVWAQILVNGQPKYLSRTTTQTQGQDYFLAATSGADGTPISVRIDDGSFMRLKTCAGGC